MAQLNILDKLSSVVGSDNTPVVKKNKKFLTLGLPIVAALVVGGFIISQNYSTPAPTAGINAASGTVSSVAIKPATAFGGFFKSESDIHPINETALTKKYNAFNDIQNAGSFTLDKDISNSEIAKQVASLKLKEGNAYLSLVSYAEGFVKTPQPDAGTGYAVGNGYNASVQSVQMNQNIVSMISKDKSVIDAAVYLSGKTDQSKVDTSKIQALKVTPQQAAQMAQAMKYEFASPMPKIIGDKALRVNAKARQFASEYKLNGEQFGKVLLDNLKPNERDTMVYHVYKVGPAGFAKYNTLISNLVDYHFDKTADKADQVAASFNYKYKAGDGSIKEDKRAAGLLATMWLDTDAFKAMVNNSKTYPNGFKSRLAKVQPTSMKDTNDSAIVFNDELGDYLKAQAATGHTPVITPEFKGLEVSELRSKMEATRAGLKSNAPKKKAGFGSMFNS